MSDDVERDADVRGWLSSVEPPELRLTPAATIRAGRTRARRRRLVVSGAAAIAVLAVAAMPAVASNLRQGGRTPAPSEQPGASASAAVVCKATPLAVPDGLARKGALKNIVIATAIDPSGRYIVGRTHGSVNNSPAAVLWTDGKPAILPTEGEDVVPTAVNSHGVVVGRGWMKAAPPMSGGFAWIYRDGKASQLTMPSGYTQDLGSPTVNEAGAVLAIVYTPDRSHQAVVLWSAGATDQPQVLSALSDKSIRGVGFGTDGKPVAWSRSAKGPVLWSADGRHRTLPLVGGKSGWVVTTIRGPWAVGTALPESGKVSQVPLRWDLRGGELTVLPAARLGNAVDVNPAGDVLVWNEIVRADGRVVTLTVPAGRQAAAVGFSDAGTTIVGLVGPEKEATSPSEVVPEVPTVWHC